MAAIYLITEEVHEDAGLVFSDFKKEAWKDETEANKRFNELKSALGESSGLYYQIEKIELQ